MIYTYKGGEPVDTRKAEHTSTNPLTTPLNMSRFRLPRDSFASESFVQKREGKMVVVDDDSLDQMAVDELRKNIIAQCFNDSEVPNPFENSEFDLMSVQNKNYDRVNAMDTQGWNTNTHLLKELLDRQQQLPPPKVVKETGSLKTSTVQCPFCQRVFNVNVAKQHIPKCEKTRNRPRPPPQKIDIIQQ